MAQARAHMPPSKRAKIFAMFDALKGLKEALAAKERVVEERKVLEADAVEEINRTLLRLKKGSVITIVYYCTYSQCYQQLTGPITKVDSYWHSIQVGEICIDFEDIYDILL